MKKWDITDILKEMCGRNASDLLITAGTQPKARVNGLLESISDDILDPDATRELAYGILNEAQKRMLDEHKSVDLSRGFEGLSRFRINIYYQRDSVSMAIRKIPFDVPPFEDLNLPEIVKDFASRPNGLVLITGAAGSGKSTTLAAMIDFINRTKGLHIVCIEDPIEYLHAHKKSIVAQREILSDAHTFAEALRSVFRQSPDVIMIGEMRDLETVQLALTLAETGHLILATLHTQDTSHAVNRIVDMFPANQQQQIYVQLSLILVGVVSQQLVLTRDKTRRVMACEVMNVNNAIRSLIREMQIQQIYSVIQTGRSEGMCTMNDSLRLLFEQGIIDAETAVRRSPRPKEIARLLTLNHEDEDDRRGSRQAARVGVPAAV